MDEAFDQFDTHETKLNVDSCNSPSSNSCSATSGDNILVIGTSGLTSIGIKIAASWSELGIRPIVTSRRQSFSSGFPRRAMTLAIWTSPGLVTRWRTCRR